MASERALLSLPTELIVTICTNLHALPDIFSLAATCHRLRDLWHTHLGRIYASVGPRTIPYELYARQYLVATGMQIPTSLLSDANHVRAMLRTSTFVDRVVAQFEFDVIPRLGRAVGTFRHQAGLHPQRHPPTLSITERGRFVRSYYLLLRLWARKEDSFWSDTLAPLSLKTLYLLLEISKINQVLPGEEPVDSLSQNHIRRLYVYRGGSERQELRKRIAAELDRKYTMIWDLEAPDPEPDALSDGALCYIVIWDHWQKFLRGICCRPVPGGEHRTDPVHRASVWEESDEED